MTNPNRSHTVVKSESLKPLRRLQLQTISYEKYSKN
jgi:hypothetical protein